MREALQRAWDRRGAVATLLLPVSWLYGAIVALRRALVRPTRLPVPVIVVGNVVAGGAGKTPVVIAVVEHLRARGIAAGVVSRGYGRRTRGCLEVQPAGEPLDTGDEPLLVRRRTGMPVFVGERRVDAAQALLRACPGTRAIVSDDGLQHHALARDIEICVFDERGVRNGRLLPAGPLREPWPRPVDFILRAGVEVTRALAPYALRGDGTRIALDELRGRKLRAVAGIANPGRFFTMLRACGIEPAHCTPLPDHHDFGDAPSWPGDELICTEKDAVKLWKGRPDAWAVPLAVHIDESFWQAFDARLSSLDGPQTP